MKVLMLVVVNLVLLVAAIVSLLVIIELIAGMRLRRRRVKEKMVVLSVRVPRDIETGPITAEQIFATIHGVSKEVGLWERLRGIGQDRISFEIANVGRDIRFFVCFPEKLRNLVEGQFYAQYPSAEILEVKDYVFKNDGETIVGVKLKMSDVPIYPIKRYSQFEDKKSKYPVDPLASITSTLSKFNHPDEQAWIQIVVSPLEDRWRRIYTKCVRLLGQGIYLNIESLQRIFAKMFCTRSRLKRIVFFPVYWLFGIQALKAGSLDVNDSDFKEQISSSHDRETPLTAAMDKAGRLLFEATIRIIYVPKVHDKELAEVKLREIVGSFKQFNLPQLNGFELGNIEYGDKVMSSYKTREIDGELVLNVEELATIYHLPNITVNTPNIYWVRSKRMEPPNDLPIIKMDEESDVNVIGKTNFRGSSEIFGIKGTDRRRHLYIIGKTGMGKSTLLENMIYSDIQQGRGVAVVDPHGDLAEAVLKFVPSNRINDVILFDPSDREYPVAFNMFENVDPALNSIVCSGLVGIFKKIYADSWGPRLEHILRNTILSLLEYSNTSMLGISRILQDRAYRQKVVRKINDPIVKSFWLDEFEKMEPRMRTEAISPILNKVGQFLSSPVIRNIVGQVKSSIDLRFAMDKGKIIIVNLSKGKIGEDNSALLGAMLITKFQLDAMSRANVPEKDRKDFYLYVDEFQNFATDSFATILSEARKYKLNLTMANQYIAQMPDEVRDAVFGNVGSTMAFQVGFDDAEYITNAFGEEVTPNDLTSLNKYSAYMRLLIDGMPTGTFSLDTLPPPVLNDATERVNKIIRISRERYAEKREVVEDKISRWSAASRAEDSNK